MISIVSNPSRSEWPTLMQRAITDMKAVDTVVAEIVAEVRRDGDAALRRYAERFDGCRLDDLRVSTAEIDEATALVSADLRDAIAMAADNICRFHSAQQMKPLTVEVMPGVVCSQRAVAIDRVGLYIPGGNSPLFSTVLMLAIPARIAGCRRIVLCTPADRQGRINPAILYAAKVAGVNEIYKSGGAQAIAAMAYGTETVPRVDKIFGPGNRFVMEAKKLVSSDHTAIDMPAGPSEVMIVADDSADIDFIATDFLSQAEHGPDSQSMLLTTSPQLAAKLPDAIERYLQQLPRREMMERSLSHSRVIVFADIEALWDFANEYAPEHLIINCADAETMTSRVRNAGSVFIGPYSPESAGDYASGTNHTLPTSAFTHSYSGVNLDSFIKKITFQHLTADGLSSLGRTVQVMAENESLMAHRLAVTVRMEKSLNDPTKQS